MAINVPFKPERAAYTPLDFTTWRESGALSLAPKFQRRGVWGRPAKAYLIDTMIRGLPVPPIYLRVRQSDDKKRTIREVIDGQQRISAVLDFLDGKFALTPSLDAPYAGKEFKNLDWFTRMRSTTTPSSARSSRASQTPRSSRSSPE